MASSSSNFGANSKKIIVRGIPSNCTSDKLTIHFQKKKNVGGGDVQSVTFPLSNKESDTAIITFEEPETVQSVLRYKHKISGSEVTVEIFGAKPQIFESVTAKISEYAIQQLKIKSDDVDDELESIMDSTGCDISRTENKQGYEAKGEWYQLQAAFERIENVIAENLENKDHKKDTENGYLARGILNTGYSNTPPFPTTQFHPESKPPLVNQPSPIQSAPRSPTRATQEVVSTVIDKDMYAYMKLVRQSDLDDIKKKFDVDMNETIVGDASKIVLSPTAPDANLQKAAKSLDQLHNTVSNSVSQDIVKIDSKLPDETLERIFATLCPEVPQVHIARVYSSRDSVIFTAVNHEKCRMAMEMFKHFLQREAPSQVQDSKSETEKDKNVISVDKDIFAFLELTRSDTLDRIWVSNGVKLDTQTVGDCLNIKFHPLAPHRNFKPETAIDEFQKLYNQVQEKAAQETYELKKKHEDQIGKQQIAEAIRLVREIYKDVYVTVMHSSSDHVLFITDNKEKCVEAMTTFGSILSAKKK